MTHFIRAAALLGMLVLAFLLFRSPPSTNLLARSGFFQVNNQAANEVKWASLPVGLLQPSTCQDCHQQEYRAWEKSAHQSVSCVSCHGPAREHVEDGARLAVDQSREFCELCHAQQVSRPSKFPQIDPDSHGGQTTCVTCHDPRAPKFGPRVPHSLDGRYPCEGCHIPGVKEPLEIPDSHAGRPSETCTQCHQAK
ncbi:MAG: hypothetical protein HYY01_05455 [Chloroflexi bacterium]|nr:hypothetical protein [Chloroflexota bacterium]